MAKKPTEKQLYKLKNEWLGQFFEEVKPKEFYRAVFPEGSFERKGHFEDGKANGIITTPGHSPHRPWRSRGSNSRAAPHQRPRQTAPAS